MVEDIVEKHVNKLYASEEVTAPWRSFVEDLEQRLIAGGSFDITRDFLSLMFLKPQITQQLHLVSAKTIDSFQEAVRTQDAKLVKEWGFFVFNRGSEGFFASVAPESPAAYDLPVPEREAVEDPKRQTMVMVHTHPPIDSVLVPSIIVRTAVRKDVRKYAGDLYTFLRIRELSKESKVGSEGREVPEFVERPLSLILQDHPESESTKMLFIRESEQLVFLSAQEYINELQRNRRRVTKAKSEDTMQKVLADLGFHSSYLRLSIIQFYDYPFLLSDQINMVAEELGLN